MIWISCVILPSVDNVDQILSSLFIHKKTKAIHSTNIP